MNQLLHLLGVIVVAAIVYAICKVVLTGVALTVAGLVILLVAVVAAIRLIAGDRSPL